MRISVAICLDKPLGYDKLVTMKNQLVLWPEPKFIDKTANAHYCIEPFYSYLFEDLSLSSRISFLDSPWSKYNYHDAEKYIVDLTYRIIYASAPRLNKMHGVSLSLRQWEILLFSELYPCLFDAYYIYLKLSSLERNDYYTIGLSEYHAQDIVSDRYYKATYFGFTQFHDVEAYVYLWSYIAKKWVFK